MITPSTPPPELPPEQPSYVQQRESPYKQFDDAIAENSSPLEQCSEAAQNKKDESIDVFKKAKEGVYDPLKEWANNKQNKNDRKRENDTAELSRNDERSAVGGSPDPEPTDARQCDLSNEDMAHRLADANGISLAPDVASDYRVNTSPYADLAQDLADQPGRSTQPAEDIQETLKS